MAIWVDADACPNVIKEILFRAAERTQTPLTLVANQPLRVPPSRFIRTLRVEQGFDVADNEIVRQCAAGDLVITADIPLAAEVLAKGGAALNPRGERYSEATIRERLTMRDFMETLRASGVQTGGPDSLSQRDRQQFAAELEKWLLAVKRRQVKPSYRHRCQNHRRQSRVEVVVPGIVGKELIVSWRNGSSPAVVSCAMLSCAEAASGCGFSSMILTISCGCEPLNILVSILPSTTPPATPAAVCSAPAIKPPPRAAACGA